jgi:hypothetical protein
MQEICMPSDQNFPAPDGRPWNKRQLICQKRPLKPYAKETLVRVERTPVNLAPKTISTSFIERQNLTLRMSQRRLTRLSNGFSKKYENHCAAVALYVTHYNFYRVHETLRITPDMQLGITDHVWGVTELVNAALSDGAQAQVKRAVAEFQVIRGGKQ